MNLPKIRFAELELSCSELDPNLQFFRDCGFRLDAIFPADSPRTAVLSGHGLRLRLTLGEEHPTTIRLGCDDPQALEGSQVRTAPNGTRLEFVAAVPPLLVPELRSSLVIDKLDAAAIWEAGRAGMHYRDLIEDRQGGRFIASHIQIAEGGEVPDYVHYHKVRFQMIYCYRGWVKVVYEDQGPPFVMEAGDCVLQPPEIRHRVLECSAGLEVIEIGCPADHETHADHDLELPNETVDPGRDFSGQEFTCHRASQSTPQSLDHGYVERDLGMHEATHGLARARVLSGTKDAPVHSLEHDGELLFFFVLEGQPSLRGDGIDDATLPKGTAVTVPPGTSMTLSPGREPVELLELRIPSPRDTDA